MTLGQSRNVACARCNLEKIFHQRKSKELNRNEAAEVAGESENRIPPVFGATLCAARRRCAGVPRAAGVGQDNLWATDGNRMASIRKQQPSLL